MKIDNLLKTIQDTCNDFITQNLDNILTQLEENKASLDNKFSEFKIDTIDKKSWGVYVFYMKPQKTISTFDELSSLWETDLGNKRLHSPKVIKSKFKTLDIGQSVL